MDGGYVILDKAISEKIGKALQTLEDSFDYEGAYNYLKEIALCGKPVYLPSFEVKDVPSPQYLLVVSTQIVHVQCVSDTHTGLTTVGIDFRYINERVQLSVSNETPNIFNVFFLQGE